MRPLFLIFFLYSFFNSFGQSELTGKWYTFSSDMIKVVEYNFEKPNFFRTKFDWKLNKQEGPKTAKIIKTIEQNGNMYYIFKNIPDTTVITLSIFSDFKADTSFILATASDKHTNFTTVQDVVAFIQVDTFKRVGLTFYSENEFKRLKSLPDPLTITKEKYKLYLQGLISERQKFETYASQHKDDFGFMFFIVFLSNQARNVFANLGYNPIIDDRHLAEVNDKFKSDVELKDLIEKALKFK